MFPSSPYAVKTEKKQITREQFDRLVMTGEILHANLHDLPKEEAKGYLPHFDVLNRMIEEGKKIFRGKENEGT